MSLLQGLREQRASVDTGTGERRVADQRASHIGRGTFVNKQADLGISTTEPRAKEIRQKEAEYQTNVQDYQSRLDEASAGQADFEAKVAEAQAKLPDVNKLMDTAWNQFDKENYAIIKPRLYKNPAKDPQVRIQKATFDKVMQHTVLTNGPVDWSSKQLKAYEKQPVLAVGYIDPSTGHLVIQRSRPNFNYRFGDGNDVVKGLQQIHDSEWQQAKENFLKTQRGEAEAVLQKSQAEIDAARSRAEANQALIDESAGILRGTKEQHQAQWDKIYSDYDKRRQMMRQILGGIKVG